MTQSTDLTKLIATARSQALGDLLRRSAQRHPERLAVIDGDVRLDFASFDNAVNACAAALSDRGVRPGDRLALVSRNCWQFAVLNFATARIGVVLVPVNFGLGASEIAYILDHSGAVAVVAEDRFVPVVSEALNRSATKVVVRGWIGKTGTPPVGWEDAAGWTDDPTARPPLVQVGDDDVIRLMYTSGTESRPKGVMLTSKALISQYVSCAIDGGMTADDIDLHTLPMYHCAQLDCFFSVDIYLGATSIILPGPDAAEVLRTIEQQKVTKFFAPPTVWIAVLQHPDFDTRDLSSLRKGYYGASPMPIEVLQELGRRLPNVNFWNFYGQTEMSPVATILQPHDQVTHAGSAGRPVLNVETRVVDDDGHSLPAGQVGEIVHRSPHATLGYYADEEKTVEAFAGGWFHSGDLGRLDADGYLTVVDRKKDMIKTGGENVASREVEEALYLLEGVAEVAVFGVPHPKWIEAVTAVVVPKAQAHISEDDIHVHLAQLLAPYKRPKYVVLAAALPKNPSGKILKKDLRITHAALASAD